MKSFILGVSNSLARFKFIIKFEVKRIPKEILEISDALYRGIHRDARNKHWVLDKLYVYDCISKHYSVTQRLVDYISTDLTYNHKDYHEKRLDHITPQCVVKRASPDWVNIRKISKKSFEIELYKLLGPMLIISKDSRNLIDGIKNSYKLNQK